MGTLNMSACQTKNKAFSPMSGIECDSPTSPVRIILPRKKNIPFIPTDEFKRDYVFTSEKLGTGMYGKVVGTVNGLAVKILPKSEADLNSFIRELNFYASVTHPCIMKPIGWSYDEDHLYLIMPKGKDLQEAFDDDEISIEQIIADAVSAIACVNSINLCHCDIKNTNFVLLNGRAVLIDPGIACVSKLSENGSSYIEGASYSGWYRDPEYIADDWNDTRSEVYALGMLVYCLEHGGYGPGNGNYYNLKSVNVVANWVLLRTIVPVSERITITDLAIELHKNFGLTIHKGIHHTNVNVASGTDKEIGTILFGWLTEVAADQQFEVETLFLAVSLFQRSLGIILPRYLSDRYQRTKIQLLASMCMCLAAEVLGKDKDRTRFNFWVDCSLNSFDIKECKPMMMAIIDALDCVLVTPTYWNYASSAEDLVLLLQDAFRPDYSPHSIRSLIPGNDKNITVYTLCDKYGFNYEKLNLKQPVPQKYPAIIKPCTIKQNRWARLIGCSSVFNLNLSMITATLLTYRKIDLSVLDPECARELYERLYNNKHITHQVLDRVCKFEWRSYSECFFSYYSNLHPFTITSENLAILGLAKCS